MTVTVMATTMDLAPFSTTMIDNTAPEPSMTADTTTAAVSPSSSTGEETTTITEPGLSMKTNIQEPVTASKAANTYTMSLIGTAK